MKKWWRRNRHWVVPLLIALVVLAAAAASTFVMGALVGLMGVAVNLSMMGALMMVQAVFYFGFLMYYLGGVKVVRVMPGQAGEVTLEDDYWGQPELVKVARQWVSLLEHPERLREMGGQPITGVLLSGPPGSGKTHLARCMAGTAAVPFLGLDGSRLISMWLGVGSIKVMRLFGRGRKLAKRFGACIVFVDELDAIGGSRGAVTGQSQAGMFGGAPFMGAGTGVLNTLLTQMDGINESQGGLKSRWYKLRGKKMPPPDYTVFVMGATNRPDVLDPALTRAGRLDVKIRVDPTDKAGRLEVIRGYLEQIECAAEIDVEGFAADTTGLTPADLKTIIARRATSRAVFAGRTGMRLKDKQAIAYHEAGHAVATWALTRDKITRTTIIRYSGGPSGGGSLGHVYHVPEEEQWSHSLKEMEDGICVSLSGRAAELEFLGEAHTGAAGDLLSVRARLLSLAAEGYFSSLMYRAEPSEALVKEMDDLVVRSTAKAREILRTHAEKVKALVAALLDKEELDADEVAAILGERPEQEETQEEEAA